MKPYSHEQLPLGALVQTIYSDDVGMIIEMNFSHLFTCFEFKVLFPDQSSPSPSPRASAVGRELYHYDELKLISCL